MDVADRRRPIALVTGANGALGRAITAALRKDYFTIGTDLDEASAPCDAFYACDVRDSRALQALFDLITERHGPTQHLVNNAAIYQPCGFLAMNADQIDLTFSVNVRALLLATQHAARQMIAAGVNGAVVNIASQAGRDGSPTIDYAASKAAVINITRSTARALASANIRVNAVAPGVFRSAMSDQMSAENFERMMRITPMARIGEAEEIADAVAYLLGPRSTYVTGATLDVNGGI